MPDIFQEAGLPLWLRPYEVLVTSSYTALIETIPDTVIFLLDGFKWIYCEKIFDLFDVYFCRPHFMLSKVDFLTSQVYVIFS